VFDILVRFAQNWPMQALCTVVGAVGAAAFMPTPAPIAAVGAFLVALAMIWSLPAPGIRALARDMKRLTSVRHYLATYGLGLFAGAVLVWAYAAFFSA
jgi:hypothetical protein